MRTETRKYEVYKVDELSDKAKENAYWKWLKGFEYDASDNRATLKAFEEIFKRGRGRTVRCAVAEIHREQLLAQPFQAQDLLAQKGLPQTAQKSDIRNQ
eukprot:8277465-Prorocentrum_lima.AAC.1